MSLVTGIQPLQQAVAQTSGCAFKLTSIRVMGDGRSVRAQWEAGRAVGQAPCSRLTTTGFPDYQPGVADGAALTATYTSGAEKKTIKGEVIDVQSYDYNQPQSWVNSFEAGGSLANGTDYIFQVVLSDPNGFERFTHLYTASGNPSGYDGAFWGISNDIANAKVTLQWRRKCPAGWSLQVYGLAAPKKTNLNIYDMRLIKAASCTNDQTSISITDYAPQPDKPVPYTSTTWEQTFLLDAPIPFGASPLFSAPAGLLKDEKGSLTEALTDNVTASGVSLSVGSGSLSNGSSVGTDEWLATSDNPNAPFGAMRFDDTIYISYSRGRDDTGDGSIGNPLKTASKAFTKYDSFYRDPTRYLDSTNKLLPPKIQNLRIRFLRGDTWPASDQWKRAFWGASATKPFQVDSYWNPAYGVDPQTRPVITVRHPYWDTTSDQPQSTFQQEVFTCAVDGCRARRAPEVPDGWSQPYTVIQGLYFKADTSYQTYALQNWPLAGNYSDHQIMSDCRVSNIQLVPGGTMTFGRPPIGGMIHRSVIHDVVGSGADMPMATGDTNEPSGGTTLYLHKRLAHPVLAADIPLPDPNNPATITTSLNLSLVMGVMNLIGWTAEIKDLTTQITETKTLLQVPNPDPVKNPNFNIWSLSELYPRYLLDQPFTRAYSANSTKTLITLSPPTGAQFTIYAGTGADPKKIYTVQAYDRVTRAATVSPAMPQLDESSKITWQPQPISLGPGNFASGLHGFTTSDLVFSQNVVDHTGWSRADNDPKWNSVFQHGLYISSPAHGWLVWGNWILDNASFGVQLRGGGTLAYNVVATNAHGIFQSATSSMQYKNLLWKNGNLQLQGNRGLALVINHAAFDFNMVLAPSFLDEKRTVPLCSSGYVCINPMGITLNYAANELTPRYVVARNNTFVGVGAIGMGVRPPVPGRLTFIRNVLDNGALTDPHGGSIPLSNVPIPMTNWNINGPLQVAADSKWENLDYNAYRVKDSTPNWRWMEKIYKNLTALQASGRELHSIDLKTDALSSLSYGLEAWAQANGTGTTYDDLRKVLKTREQGKWTAVNDTTAAYKKFQELYQLDKTVTVDTSPFGRPGAAGYPSVTIQPPPTATPTATPTPITVQCSDGLDNDRDGLVDLSDPGCVGGQDRTENDEPTIVSVAVDAVVNNADHATKTGYFSYNNTAGVSVSFGTSATVGTINEIVGSTVKPPTTFEPGLHKGAVKITIPVNSSVSWGVRPPQGALVVATVSGSSPVAAPLEPIAECRQPASARGQAQVVFGYNNPNGIALQFPIGALNRFSTITDRGQPTTFLPGRNAAVFKAKGADSGDPGFWSLNGTTTGTVANLPLCTEGCLITPTSEIVTTIAATLTDLLTIAKQSRALLKTKLSVTKVQATRMPKPSPLSLKHAAIDTRGYDQATTAIKKLQLRSRKLMKQTRVALPATITNCPEVPAMCAIIDNGRTLSELQRLYRDVLRTVRRIVRRIGYRRGAQGTDSRSLLDRASMLEQKGRGVVSQLPRYNTQCPS